MKKYLALAVLTAWLLICVSSMATSTVPTAQTLNVHAYVGRGTAGRDEKILEYDDTASVGLGTTSNAQYRQQIKLAASATDTSVNLATYFDNASYISVKEISGATSGVLWGPSAGGANKFTLSASGVLLFKNGAATPPTLYFTNPSGADAVYIEVAAVGNRT